MAISPFWWWFPRFCADFLLPFSVFCAPFQGDSALVHGESHGKSTFMESTTTATLLLWSAPWRIIWWGLSLFPAAESYLWKCIAIFNYIIYKKKIFMSNQRQTYFALIYLAYIASFQVWHKVWAHLQYIL